MPQIRILLVDDHTLIRHGVRRILASDEAFVVVAESSSGLEAIEMARQYRPDVVVMDISMPDLNGIEATSQIMRDDACCAVLILSMLKDERYVLRAMKAGAKGYLLKDALEDELIEAIHVLHEGSSFLSPSVAQVLFKNLQTTARGQTIDDCFELLSARERQIYQMLAEGNSNKMIAGRLGLSLHTVETHRVHIMEKMNLHSVAELVLSAVRRGLVC